MGQMLRAPDTKISQEHGAPDLQALLDVSGLGPDTTQKISIIIEDT